jgi:hypothetical protein
MASCVRGEYACVWRGRREADLDEGEEDEEAEDDWE